MLKLLVSAPSAKTVAVLVAKGLPLVARVGAGTVARPLIPCLRAASRKLAAARRRPFMLAPSKCLAQLAVRPASLLPPYLLLSVK